MFYIKTVVKTVTIGNIDIVSTGVKWAILCAISSYVGFKEDVPRGRRYLCTQVGLSCQIVSGIFTNGDPVSEGQLLENYFPWSQSSPSNMPRSHRGIVLPFI